jgi:hypothetical protein
MIGRVLRSQVAAGIAVLWSPETPTITIMDQPLPLSPPHVDRSTQNQEDRLIQMEQSLNSIMAQLARLAPKNPEPNVPPFLVSDPDATPLLRPMPPVERPGDTCA